MTETLAQPNPSPAALSTDELITANMAVVGHIVRETMGRLPSYVDRDDLTSAGLTALVTAARSFDPERGVPFARYAATRIRGAVLDELRGIDWASRTVRRRARELDATRSALAVSLGRPATPEEVASATGLTARDVAANEDDIARAQVLSLQGSEDSTLDDLIPNHGPSPEAILEHRERLTYMVGAIAELPDRLRVVVEGYFLAERPMAEIAEELGVSESRVSQLRAEALVLLRDAINHGLEPELVVPSSRPGGCVDRRRHAYFDAVATRHAVSSGRRAVPAALDATA
ncbi:sigma-70 family RNA polymerase sigma factor [Nocardioides sp. LHG3406-4]|uniref:sigma-70 family RNA polymerase sigma factor n=1 Tax=Nocardioides sp. LHG3406-4 TaxID=2804575 RepID=UPI003CFB00B4